MKTILQDEHNKDPAVNKNAQTAARTVDELLTKNKKAMSENTLFWEKSDFVAGRNYWFFVVLFAVVVLMVAVLTVLQIQERHQVYRELTLAKNEFQKMQIEKERLILEQQTFSATPMVAERAVSELQMFYPSENNRISINTAK